MNEKVSLQDIFIFGLFALLFCLIVCMMQPFATVLLWTALLYVLIRPLYLKVIARLNSKTRFFQAKRHLLAGVFAVGTLILIVGPIIFLGIQLVQQGISFLQIAETYIRKNSDTMFAAESTQKLFAFVESIGIPLPDANFESVKNSVLDLIQTYSSRLFSIGKSVINTAGTFFISLLFIVFALYFCFLDGPYLGGLIKKAIPINPTHMKILMRKFADITKMIKKDKKDITKNLFSGYILVALYQGLASFLLMLAFGIPAALLLSVTLMLASFVPLFGAAIIWFPIGIILCATTSVIKGIAFLVLAAICISFLDNFLRPLFLKDRIHVHPLVIFFAILGGLKVFGMNGLVLGPLIVILFFTVLDLMIEKKSTYPDTSIEVC